MVPAKMTAQLIRSLFRKPATIRYPFVRVEVYPNYRGEVTFNPDLCIGCKICSRDCPAGAIEVIKLEGEEKKFKSKIHLGKCIFCAQCAEGCPRKAITVTAFYELAVLSPKGFEKEYLPKDVKKSGA